LRAVPPRPVIAPDSSNSAATPLPLPAKAPVRKPLLRFPVNPDTRSFYRRFYPGTTTAEWNDWRWQMRTRIRDLKELSRIFVLSDDERSAVERHEGALPVGITPFYAILMGLDDPA
jgi:lysine 2,3-aminomutase